MSNEPDIGRTSSIKHVSPRIIRQEFNASQFYDKVKEEEFEAILSRPERHADPEMSGQVYCTMSQTVEYYNSEGLMVAKIHQYLLPDKVRLGGSGKPDPKWLRVRGRIFGVRAKRSESRMVKFIENVYEFFLGIWLILERWKENIKIFPS